MSARFFILAVALGFSACRQKETELNIAAAANVYNAIQKITDSFTKETGIACHITAGSSGNLSAQIGKGAPYDLFVSADTGYPLKLHDQGLTVGNPRIYAYGSLVLWTIHDSLPDIKKLDERSIRHIAMANPTTAPYGVAAQEALKYYQLYDSVKSRLVYGQSISQTNQFILSGSADVGFTSLSTVLSDELKSAGQWYLVPASSYAPIAQAAVILKGGNAPLSIKEAFWKYLMSPQASAIFRQFGYSTKPAQ